MAEYFYGIKFGEIQQHNEMVVLPVHIGNEGNTKYLTLKEAMEKNLVSGRLSRLMIRVMLQNLE